MLSMSWLLEIQYNSSMDVEPVGDVYIGNNENVVCKSLYKLHALCRPMKWAHSIQQAELIKALPYLEEDS